QVRADPNPASGRPAWEEKLPLVYIFTAPFLVRLLYLFQIRGLPYFYHPIIDPKQYDDLARALFTSGEAWRSTAFYQAPGYAYFLAIVYKIFGSSRALAHVLQM